MDLVNKNIQIISAPSILGLKPSGVEMLSEALMATGLQEALGTQNKIVRVETLNALYSGSRDPETQVLNPKPIREFSLKLGRTVGDTMDRHKFPFVLGGDCSILVGIMSALKAKGNFGLVFFDAHADFYEPEKSTTGEVADMDLAIVTGRGPEMLSNINGLRPYVNDEAVIHVGQRDWEESLEYGSRDIRKTDIKCFSLDEFKRKGANATTTEVLEYLDNLEVKGFWIHYDTDVLSDEINPAVDYRLPEGLQFDQVEYLVGSLLGTGKVVGISVTIFNPKLDKTGEVAKNLSRSLAEAFTLDIRR